ncbi:hypothetical protein BDV96DRAFT_658731 [Lophiotrema nucula]|uniref:Cholesterol oxidase n=1 Tax=Lophiotrema nucula TaxID=690887 RepID=A0A6A5ZB09_9PLEO|nr:hypothetical protein BDV96DRAFT_658731 [Lophiotrema nucula]
MFHDVEERAQTKEYPRLSRPPQSMRPEYDVVVVGSGYGGGVAASRMARAGKKVAILELGAERWPGEYPSSFTEVTPELHYSSASGSHGRRTGLYHVIEGEGQNVLVANGLGGTSLINANVFLRSDHRTLELPEWSEHIRSSPELLDQYYARAEHMLQPTPYPHTLPIPQKLAVFEAQAKAIGQHSNFYRVPQTTFFHDGLNNAGVEVKASTGSGQDLSGINDGSKNSVLMTYLPDAWNHGAEIFCECEVRYIRKAPDGNGYLVFFAHHGDRTEAFKDTFYNQLTWIRAKEFVFLGAGAIGTTEILLRSQLHGLSMSPMVGQKISGNGDLLSFGYNCNKNVNGIGREKCPPSGQSCGPTITSVIDMRGTKASPSTMDGYVIQEGAIPEALAHVIESLLDRCPNKVYPVRYKWYRKVTARLKTLIFGPYAIGSSLNRTQSYLVMSHDSNEGIMTLEDDKPKLQFLGVERKEHIRHIQNILARMTHSNGGTLINADPETTVHPLGGARMSSGGTGRTGAVNHLGQLFTGDGEDVYDGIVAVDGSIIPTALGVNPLATITALAERSCDILIKQKGWKVHETPNGRLNLLDKPAKSLALRSKGLEVTAAFDTDEKSDGIRFTEIMEGFFHVGDDIEDFAIAEKVAQGSASSARLFLSVDIASVEDLTSVSVYAAVATGTFSCGALSQDPLLITRGRVQFFALDDTLSDGAKLAYRLTLLDTRGETYLLEGQKNIDSGIAFSASEIWKATTTLYTTLKRADGTVVGKGILRLSWRNFASELRTLRPYEQNSLPQKLLAPARFVSFFARNTVSYFLSPFRPLEYPDTSKSGYFKKVAPTLITLTAKDGVQTTMKIWEPKQGTTLHPMPILLIPGASVDDQIFSCPTIPTNAVDFFTSLGYRCYIPVMRFGIDPNAKDGWTCYDTRWDIKAAMEYVREQEGGRKFYAIVHCLGSITTSIALLTGVVKAEWMAGMTVSQVFCDLRFSKDNGFKASHPALVKGYKAIAGDWFSCHSSPTSPWAQFLIDQILRFYPIGPNYELCNSSICHRCTLVFGRCFTHANLNHATHQHLASYFSGIHLNFLTHLMTMGAKQPHHVRSNLNTSPLGPSSSSSSLDDDADFRDLVEEDGNLERLKGLKIQFLSGGDNVVFDPLSTATSYNMLRETFGEEGYERVVVGGYGHLDTWMGKDSLRDVYLRVRGFIEQVELPLDSYLMGNLTELCRVRLLLESVSQNSGKI